MYAYGLADEDLPEGMTWRSFTLKLTEALDKESKPEVAQAIQGFIGMHYKRTNDPIPDGEPSPKSGLCWKYLCKIARVGSDKFARQSQKVNSLCIAARVKAEKEGRA